MTDSNFQTSFNAAELADIKKAYAEQDHAEIGRIYATHVANKTATEYDLTPEGRALLKRNPALHPILADIFGSVGAV
jgi:hypothetical protein